jgi:hypothetical protein
MPVSVQWVCDRDQTSANNDNTNLPPAGWSQLDCSLSSQTGGVQPATLLLCPVCTEALSEWLGKPVFKQEGIGRNVVPMET